MFEKSIFCYNFNEKCSYGPPLKSLKNGVTFMDGVLTIQVWKDCIFIGSRENSLKAISSDSNEILVIDWSTLANETGCSLDKPSDLTRNSLMSNLVAPPLKNKNIYDIMYSDRMNIDLFPMLDWARFEVRLKIPVHKTVKRF